MKKLTRLTKAQKAQMPAWAEKWIKIGLTAEPADRPLAEAAVRAMYDVAKIPQAPIIWVDSPITGAFAASLSDTMIRAINEKKEEIQTFYHRAQVEGSPLLHVPGTMRLQASLKDGCERLLKGATIVKDKKINEKIKQAVVGAICAVLRLEAPLGENIVQEARADTGQVASKLLEKMTNQVSQKAAAEVYWLGPKLRGKVMKKHDATDQQLADEIERQMKLPHVVIPKDFQAVLPVPGELQQAVQGALPGGKNDVKLQWHGWFGGQFWSAWASYTSFLVEVCKMELDQEIMERQLAYSNLCRSACYIWPNKNFVMICERPVRVCLNQEGRLHKDGDMAIEFPDGWGLWRLNGVSVPKWLGKTKAEKIDPVRFAKLDNVELRREFIRKVGIERIVDKCETQQVDSVGNYELLKINLGGRTGFWPYLKMKNPSIGVFHLEAVPLETESVTEALKWRNGTSSLPRELT